MELRINNETVDLPEGAAFALTIQSNDITKPDTVQSSYSNSLTLPLTERNNRILGNSHDVTSLSDVPYRKLECDVLQDGVEVMPKPKAYLLQASEGYELDIFSGSIDLFEKLGDKSIQDLDLSRFDHLWDAVALPDSHLRTYSDGFVYDVIDRGKPFEDKTTYPSVFAKTVLEQLLTEAGVTYTFTEPLFSDLILPFSNDYPRHSQKWIRDNQLIPFMDTGINPGFPVNNYGVLVAIVNATVTQAGHAEAKLYAALYRNSVLVGEQQEVLITGPGSYELKAEFRIEPEEDLSQLEIRMGPLSWEQSPAVQGTWGRYYTYTDEAFFSTQWELAVNLPDIKQKDFFKSILALFNLMPSFDPYSSTLRLVPMQALEQNKAKALDWSGKLVTLNNAPVPVQYRFGEFARKSWLRYKEDGFIFPSGDHFLTVDDEQLEEEKNVIELPFAASEDRGYLYIPMFEQNDALEWVRRKIEPRIAVLSREPQALGMARSSFAPIRFESLVPTYYATLQNILDRCKGITPYFLLDASDVQAYDCSVPVWLEQYQAYFYLNQITEYTGEGPTQCQLWRL